jgi:hypothetical protein
MFWESLSHLSSRVMQSKSPWIILPFKMGLTGCPETLVTNNQTVLLNTADKPRPRTMHACFLIYMNKNYAIKERFKLSISAFIQKTYDENDCCVTKYIYIP